MQRNKNLLWLVGLIAVASLLAGYRPPSPTSASPSSSAVDSPAGRETCLANLEDIYEAAMAYAQIHQGRYPANLRELGGQIPSCPAGGAYSASNDVNAPGNTDGLQNYCLITCGAHENLGYNNVHGALDPLTGLYID